MIDEEKELNEMDSPFKRDLQEIYHKCYESFVKANGSILSANKITKAIRQWLSYLNQHCMPTVPIWSNLLLGINAQ